MRNEYFITLLCLIIYVCPSWAQEAVMFRDNVSNVTFPVPEKSKMLEECVDQLQKDFPNADIRMVKLGIVSVIGSNMRIPGFLARAAAALYEAEINVHALDQTLRQVNIQFMVERQDFETAQKVLHCEFVEKKHCHNK